MPARPTASSASSTAPWSCARGPKASPSVSASVGVAAATSEVLAHGQVVEQLQGLEAAHEPAPGPLVRRQVVDELAGEGDLAAVRGA